MSAPAMKLSGLPEMSTAARMAVVVPQADEQRFELDLDRVAQLVDGLAGRVEGDDRDAVLDDGGERGH